MFRILVRLAVAAIVIGAATIATARLNNPPSARTNAPAIGAYPAEPTCNVTGCHTGAPINDGAGLLEILDVPNGFQVNTTYPIRVRLSHTFDPPSAFPLHWGFELTVVTADSGTGYGTFSGTPGDVSTITPVTGNYVGRTYVRHDTLNHTGDLGPVEWTFDWTTPGYLTDKVIFYAAGNAANGDDNPNAADRIYTGSKLAIRSALVGVPDLDVAQTQLSSPAPNPSLGRDVSLSYSLARSGNMDISVFDVNGRHVRTLLNGYREAGPSYVTWNRLNEGGSRVASGVYFARLVAPGGGSPLVRKITISD